MGIKKSLEQVRQEAAERKKRRAAAIEQLFIFFHEQIKSGKMHDLTRQTHFRQPFTIVMLRERQGRIGVGAARKCVSDEWSDEIGEDLATRRACRDLARHVFDTTVAV